MNPPCINFQDIFEALYALEHKKSRVFYVREKSIYTIFFAPLAPLVS